MQCSICHNDPVIYQPYSGQHLCREHFIASVDAKVKRDIRRHHGLQSNDHIGVLQDGNLPAQTLFFFLANLTKDRKDIRVSAISTGAGIPSGAGLTKLAVATTLEDAATSVLASVLRGQPGQQVASVSAGNCPTIPVIVPFSHIPAEEIALYGRLCGIAGDKTTAPQEPDPFLCEVKSLLAEYTGKHPATPHAVLNLGESLETFGIKDNGCG
jgi:hypothetical protein